LSRASRKRSTTDAWGHASFRRDAGPACLGNGIFVKRARLSLAASDAMSARNVAGRVSSLGTNRVARAGATLLLCGVAIAAIRLAARTDDSWSQHPVGATTLTLYVFTGGVLYALAARAMRGPAQRPAT
jgi:hypothetical protein